MVRKVCIYIVVIVVAAFAGCMTDRKSSRTNVILPKDRPSYFYSNHLTGAGYIELKPDGTYRQIAREHMGVWQFDDGTWHQDKDGLVTLVSTTLCANIISPPLEISVVRTEYTSALPDLKNAIQAFLKKDASDQYPLHDFEPLIKVNGKHKLTVEANHLLRRKFISRKEVEALIPAIDRFLSDPSEMNCRAVPMYYKQHTFLLWLNCNTPNNRSLDEIHKAIDNAKPNEIIAYHDFLISAEQFEKEVKKPYPFLFYPEMNKITGAE